MFENKSFFVVCAVLGSACAGSHANQVSDARIEQADERADAREQDIDERAKQRENAADRHYDARREAAETRGNPGSNEQEKLLDLSQERTDYQSKAQSKLDKLGVRIQAASQKMSVLAERAPTKLRTELQTATAEHQTLQQELSTMRTDRSQKWDSDKKLLEERLSQLEDRIGKLSDDIEDVHT